MENFEFIPNTKDALVLRTDFESDENWRAICDLIRMPVHDVAGDFIACVEFCDNPAFRDLTLEELLTKVPGGYNHTFFFVVDKCAIQSTEHPILVIDLYDRRGRTFRAIPSQIQGIENNLSIANMDFYEFADNVDDDGVFRDFRTP